MNQDRTRVFARATLLVGLMLMTLMGWATAAQAAISLAAATNYPVGRSGNIVRNIAVGDFNGDGNLDMAVPNSSDRDVAILLGEGGGSFTPAGAYSVDTGTGTNASPRFVVAADFNEDGVTDLAVSDFNNDIVVVLSGNGDGSFQAPASFGFGTSTGPNGMIAGDFNRDGHLDLAVATTGSNTLSFLRGNGDGTFLAALNSSAGNAPYSVAAGDFDGDGDLDLAVANRTAPGTVSVVRNNGSGTFGAPTSLTTGDNSRSVAIGDFNRDGKLDLAVANEGFFDVSILLGTGTGTFLAAVNYPAGSAPRFIATADFNGDGILDLTVTDGNDNFVYILQGSSDGTFKVAVPFMVGRRPDGVTSADFNGDGKPDVATANTSADSEAFGIYNVSVLLNTTAFEPTGLLTSKVDYPVGLNPNSMAAGDFNGDGVLDLVAANVYSDNVSRLQGVGDGTFAAAANYNAGTYPYWVTTGDFNRDGKLDLAVANLIQSGTISILLGNGNGTFQAPVNYGAGVYPVFVISGDFNRDGNPDLAAANSGSDDISILLGNGNGTFQAEVIYGVGANPYSIAVGDFNRDGTLDLAVANFYSFSVSILLGNGDGTFQAPADFGTGYNPVSVTAADLNSDGFPDLVVANYWSGDVSILSGIGDGNFLDPVSYPVGTNPAAIAVTDFSRNGKLDLVAACESADKVAIVAAKSDGTFAVPVSFATGKSPAALITGDFDRDGKIDLATTNWGASNVSVLLNWKDTVSTPTKPAGINLNGALKDKGVPGMSYGFSTGGSPSGLGHPVEYQFDWRGDGTDLSAWGSSTKSRGWDLPGTYQVRARARCATHPRVVSAWSSVLTIDIGGPTITNLQIEGGAASTSKTAVAITYSVSGSATQIRTSNGDVWSLWLTLPIVTHNVTLGATVNGLRYVYAQVKDADGRISAIAWDTINQDIKPPTGAVKINGGNTTVLSGGIATTVRAHLAMFDASLTGAQVRVKPDATFSGDSDPSAPWGPFDGNNTGRDLLFMGLGAKKVYVQFMDGVGLKSVVYLAGITVSATGIPWPVPSTVTVSNLLLNDGKPYSVSGSVKLTYDVSQSTNIKVRYLYGTAWTAWEIPAVVAGKVTKLVTLSAVSGSRQVYVQLLEDIGSARPGAMTDPKFASTILDLDPPKAFVQINQGATSLSRFNTNPNYLVLSILGTDGTSGIDKMAIFQTGSLPSTTVPPAANSPDWVDFTPTVDSFGLNTGLVGAKSVYVWLKDRAGKFSLLKATAIGVVP